MSEGCDSILFLDLTLHRVDTSVSLSNVTLTANATNVSYQWLNCDTDSLISGATNQTFTPLVDGNYAVIISDNLCTDTSACIAVNGIGLIENDFLGINLYPNPTRGTFTVELQQTNGRISLSLTDALGKLVSKEIVSENSNKITRKIKGAKGVYFVTIEVDGQPGQTFRLVKN